MKDALYDVAMQNVERYEALARRAERSDDNELAGFFWRMRDESRRNAADARRFLSQRVAE